jgi:hypothetical protein
MIDTDKYEGHTEGKWNVLVSSEEDIAQAHLHDETAGYYFFSQGANSEQEENYNHNESRANARLMSDAPLLLAEVKRLQERLDLAERYIIEPTLIRNYFADVVSKGLDDERDNLG